MRTGSTRFGPQTNSVSGASGGITSITPSRASTSLAITERRLRVEQHLERDERRVDAELRRRPRRRRSSWSVASISTSSLIGLVRRPLEAQRLATCRRLAAGGAARSVRVSVSGLYWKTTTLASGSTR